MDTIGILIEVYETKNYPEPQVLPNQMLLFLMGEHGLEAKELPEIGSEEIIKEILAGDRELDNRQIKNLSLRFHVSPTVFLYD